MCSSARRGSRSASLALLALLGWLVGAAVVLRRPGRSRAGTALRRRAGAVHARAAGIHLSRRARSPSLYSRKHEFEADAYAARNASAPALVAALVKLYEDNASTLTPDPLHSAFYDSHPPAALRIARLEAAAR